MYNQIRPTSSYPPREPIEPPKSDDEDDEEKRIIFVANLDQRVTEELLYEVFLQAGPIESVRIPKDNGGRQKTFGFITYVHKCSVPYALKLLAGLSLFRKCLTIKFKEQPAVSLPSDCEILQRRIGGNMGNMGNMGNFAMRGNNFNGNNNPFKQDSSPPNRVERGSQQRRSDELQKHPSQSSRQHQTSPYSRTDPSRDHGGGNGGNHNRHNNNNRRSEQRNRQR